MRRALLLSLAVLLGFAADAHACSCIPPDVAAAEGAFVGRVVEMEEERVVFAVERVAKGSFGPAVAFALDPAPTSCDPGLRVGQRTGVVLYGDEQALSLCNLAAPEDIAAPAPAPASLLGTLLGTCWAAIGS